MFKTYALGSLVLATVLFTGCQEEVSMPEPAATVSVWSNPSHAQLLGFQGNPKNVKQTRSFDNQILEQTEWCFDEKGLLVSYDPLSSFDKVNTLGWGNGADDFLKYEYAYDDQRRLTQVIQKNFMEVMDTFTIVYGDHQAYIPLPVRFANAPIYLVQGLSYVTSSTQNRIIYEYKGKEAFLEEKTFRGDRKLSYTIEKSYPKLAKDVLMRSGTEVSKETNQFHYSTKGYMLHVYSEFFEDMKLTRTTDIMYRDSSFFQPTMEQRGRYISLRYSYNENGFLDKIVYDNQYAGEPLIETNSYSGIDDKGNWTGCSRKTYTSIDPSIPENGEVVYTRSIHY